MKKKLNESKTKATTKAIPTNLKIIAYFLAALDF
jgi:hypothetical protein